MNSKEILSLLMDSESLSFSPDAPFTYASGLKGPLYCDNRKLLSNPDFRNIIINKFASVISKNNFEFDQFAGLATAGIPYASILADRLNKPLIYIRSTAKAHGKGNQVEGKYVKGQKILLIEDLVNQGKSLSLAIDGALKVGLVPVACLCIVTYEMQAAKEVSSKYDLPIHSLLNFSGMISGLTDLKTFNNKQLENLTKWQNNPKDYK